MLFAPLSTVFRWRGTGGEVLNPIEHLNNQSRSARLAAAKKVGSTIERGDIRAAQTDEVNNHVHTTYSFSPYHPSMAAYKAYEAGLKAVGIMDHDSVSGADEMLAAAKSIGIASTVGFEVRVNFTGTAVEGRKINNPDSKNIVYIAIHGIPKKCIGEAARFLAPINRAREKRNRAMVDALNKLLPGYGIAPLSYDRDVRSISQAKNGGAVTERHLMCALANAIIAHTGKGDALVSFVTGTLGITLPEKIAAHLKDTANIHYVYDLIGVLKSSFLDKVFIQPNDEECIPVQTVVDFGNRINAIPVYAYLGDVGESPTGDKKAEHFEDSFLDVLMPELKRLGFKGITYMPPRNTREQLKRIRSLCTEHGFMEISGVDINSSRQSFNCPIILDPDFKHLIDATWALIAHEKLAGADERYAIFNPKNPFVERPLIERIALYAKVGRSIDVRKPEQAMKILQSMQLQ